MGDRRPTGLHSRRHGSTHARTHLQNGGSPRVGEAQHHRHTCMRMFTTTFVAAMAPLAILPHVQARICRRSPLPNLLRAIGTSIVRLLAPVPPSCAPPAHISVASLPHCFVPAPLSPPTPSPASYAHHPCVPSPFACHLPFTPSRVSVTLTTHSVPHMPRPHPPIACRPSSTHRP